MHVKVNRIREDLKKVERRIGTLDEHLKHSENFKNYRKIKRKYDELDSLYKTARKATGFGAERKTQKALATANEYYETHRSELFQFDTAEKYLRDVLQGRFDPNVLPPITKWREERDTKIAEKNSLYLEYHALKDATQKVEQIKRSVADILRTESPEQTPRKSRGREL